MLCAGVVGGARFLGCWEFCGVGRFRACLAGCAGRCKKARVLALSSCGAFSWACGCLEFCSDLRVWARNTRAGVSVLIGVGIFMA